jgi:hypothetical protein
VVLSRPQFLASNLVVVADVPGGAGDPVEVTVREVVRPDSPRAKALETIAVPGLRKCEGWAGPGTYILPLTTDWKGSYRVTPMQRSPGFVPHDPDLERNPPPETRPHIYPLTEATREQLRQMPEPEQRK